MVAFLFLEYDAGVRVYLRSDIRKFPAFFIILIFSQYTLNTTQHFSFNLGSILFSVCWQ